MFIVIIYIILFTSIQPTSYRGRVELSKHRPLLHLIDNQQMYDLYQPLAWSSFTNEQIYSMPSSYLEIALSPQILETQEELPANPFTSGATPQSLSTENVGAASASTSSQAKKEQSCPSKGSSSSGAVPPLGQKNPYTRFIKWLGFGALANYLAPQLQKIASHAKQLVKFGFALTCSAAFVAGCSFAAWFLCDIWLGIAIGIIASKVIPWPSYSHFSAQPKQVKTQSNEAIKTHLGKGTIGPKVTKTQPQTKWVARVWLAYKFNLTKAAGRVDSQAKF